MLLKKFQLTNPITSQTESVYLYPDFLLSPSYRFRGSTPVTREPMKIPILLVPDEYLTSAGDWVMVEHQYIDLEILNHYQNDSKAKEKQQKFDEKLDRIQSIFGLDVCRQQNCKTVFFTGPEKIYKIPIDDMVSFNNGRLSLDGIGYFSHIDSCSVKNISDVFITGTFVHKDGETKENSQCKIAVTKK